jgi:vacuolar-type H+-ATPase subunit I/STV1
MLRMKSKSVKKNAKVIDKFMEDGVLFEDDDFWEELRGIKKKKMEDDVEEEGIKKEEERKREEVQKEMEELEKEMEKEMEKMEKEMEVKEEIKEEKNENFDDKNKRKRERDEDAKERGPYKKNTVNKCYENMCEHLANGETTLCEIFQRFPSMYGRHYKTLERIVYERDRLKKRPVPEVTWIYGPYEMGEIE